MKTEMITSGQAMVAAQNLEEIEKQLGRPIPPGLFDSTQYCDRLISQGEAFTIANNLRITMDEIDRRNGRRPQSIYGTGNRENRTKEESWDEVLLKIIVIAIAVVIGYLFF